MEKFELHPQLAKDCFQLGQFSLCELLMMNDQQYPWFILVPKRNHIKEIFELSETDYSQLNAEGRCLSQLIQKAYSADKINIATLGNMVPQLHMHIIARFITDLAWPKPVWGAYPTQAFEKHTLLERIDTLIPLLNNETQQAFTWDEQWT